MSIQSIIGKWHEATFPDCTVGDVVSKLEEECFELQNELGMYGLDRKHNAPEEAADVAIVLFGLADRLGFDLLAEVERKFAIVKNRDQRAREKWKPCPHCKSKEISEDTDNFMLNAGEMIIRCDVCQMSAMSTNWDLIPRGELIEPSPHTLPICMLCGELALTSEALRDSPIINIACASCKITGPTASPEGVPFFGDESIKAWKSMPRKIG